MEILINVVNQKLKVTNYVKALIDGSQKFIAFKFLLGSDWDGLVTFAQFIQDGVGYNQYLDENNTVYLPTEIHKGKVNVLLYGVGGDDAVFDGTTLVSGGDVIATTNYLTFTVEENSLIADAQSTQISISNYQYLVNLVNSVQAGELKRQIEQKANTTDLNAEIRRAQGVEDDLSTAIGTKANQVDLTSLADRVSALEDGSAYDDEIANAVKQEISALLLSGDLAEMTIEDGSISRSKVNSDFEATLELADGSMQKSVYDPTGYGDKGVTPYSYAETRAEIKRQEAVSEAATNLTNVVNNRAYSVNPDDADDTVTGLDNAFKGVLTRAKQYSNALLADYEPFSVEFVSTIDETQAGKQKTFYLVPKTNGSGYDKWWYVEDDQHNSFWDKFGSSTTFVVNSLPPNPDSEADYILNDNGEYQYYKYINGNWELIAGSTAQILTIADRTHHNTGYTCFLFGSGEPTSTPTSDDYENDVLYLNTTLMAWYETKNIGGGDYEWSYVGTLTPTPSGMKDYFVQDLEDAWSHFRYLPTGGKFVQIGTSAYTKEEIKSLLGTINSDMASIKTTLEGQINTIDAKVEGLGSLVSDVTETTNGIKVHYKDGTSKEVATKSSAVTVEDVAPLEGNAGIRITYTDGETSDIELSGGSGGTSSGSASITRVTDAAVQVVYGDACDIKYTFDAYDSAGDRVGTGSATWYVNNVKKATSTALQLQTNTFDIGPYLNVGANSVKISISVDTGADTNFVVTKTWTVNAVNLYLTWDYDDTTLNTSDTVAIRWTPYGDLSKTTHFIIDGTEDSTLETTTTRSGVQQYVTFSKLSHGSHRVELYLTATVNGTAIKSASVIHDMIFVDAESDVPIISSSLAQNTVTQYNTLRIPIAVYNPTSLTADVTLAVDGAAVATWGDVDRSIHYWNYTPSTYGTKTLTITCGETVKTFTITVEQLDIDNEEVTGYAFKMKASDITGNASLRSWSSNSVTATFSDNFDWNNGGIKTEEDASGNVTQYICVKAGTTMTLNYELFGNDAKVNGKNFKVIFKVMNCRDYDAKWLDCYGDGIGIMLNANSGVASSEQNTINVQYSEGSYIEFEYDIYPDSLSSAAGNPMRYIQTYIDGVLSSTNIYAANDNFTQSSKKSIVIGSPDCDVYIYLVKLYETYLTRENHIVNFIADAPNAVEMVARYDRNDVLADNGEVDYMKLATKNPNLRIHLWDIPRMTQNKIKKDPVAGCSYQQIYMAGSEADQISAENVTIGVQGTSSVNYISSAANTDGRFEDGFTDGNGNHIDGYSMSANSIPVNYFNTKVNVASCENINNMCIAAWYNDHQPYKSGAIANVPNARDCMEHHIGVQFIRDRHEDNEPVSAALFTDIDPTGSNYHMYAVCNMGNSKDNGAVFHDKNNPLECCIETKDNNSAVCMMTTMLTQEDLDSEDYFEFRYPKSPTQAMKDAFINFVNWCSSRNPAAATGNALASSVTYEPYTFKGTSEWDSNEQDEVLAGLTIGDYAGTYTHDTYEYRMARLLDECEDHFVMDSIVYHYVFVEQHAMVDNVCKNTFWGTDDLVHWHLCKNYDNDTADGNNNTGKLTIPFGAEGMDTISGGDVFNGKMNVYWQFVYGLYPARRLMWQNREAVGTWNADAYLEFATGWQNYVPERVYNQDYYYKYLRPYEQNNDTTYISMLEGGKKVHQREGFVRNNLTYMASQYMGTYCTSDSITVRAYTPGVSDDMTEDEAAIIRTTIAAVPPRAAVQVMLYNKGYVVVEVASVMKRIKAEKGVYYTIDFSESSSAMNDTVVNIHGAQNVRAIGDMSHLYIKYCNFSKAGRLRSLQIGSAVEGYTNLGLESVGFASNPMLEELYIQNCPNSASTLDLSGCQSLRILDVRGSGFTGIDFAVGALIERALLCSPASLTMRSLYYLDDANLTLDSYENITTLRFEDNPNLSSLAIVNATSKLQRVRILGIDWTLADTELLNHILTLQGMDEVNHTTDVAVLTGDVYITGTVRNQELISYANAWPNLDVSYNPSSLITQFSITYVNADDNSTVLYQTYVDQGSTPPDPYTLGLIDLPTIEPTEQYTFSFGTFEDGEYASGSGWNEITSPVYANRTVVAVYAKTIRTYNVRYWLHESDTVPYLQYLDQAYGTYIEPPTIPSDTSGESSQVYRIGTGWDKSTGFVRSDLDVYAQWQIANYIPTGAQMNEMTPAQIYAVCKRGQQDEYFADLDYVDIKLGDDYNFANVEDAEIGTDVALTGVTKDKYVSGGYYFDGSTAYTTDIVLFAEDSPAFTLAIDFQFTDTESGSTLVSTYPDGVAEGLRLFHNGTYAILEWGDVSVNVGYQKYRDIVVVRHAKGSKYLYVYAAGALNQNIFAPEVTKTSLLRNSTTTTTEPLTFGGLRFYNGYRNYGTGIIHWCKVWYDDLGEAVCQRIASWPRETVRMEYWGAHKLYKYGSSDTVNASFIANSAIGGLGGRGYWMNQTGTNTTSWENSLMRDFLNGRVYDALPQVWRSIIVETEIKTTAGNRSSGIVTTGDRLYLPALKEAGSTDSATGYVNEMSNSSDVIGWMTNNIQRAKFRGVIRKYDGQDDFVSYTSSGANGDPAATFETDITPGTLWVRTDDSNNIYVFVSQDELDMYGKVAETDYVLADSNFARGGWVRSHYWWFRSPHLGSAGNFWNGYTTGGFNPSTAYNVNSVVPSFSI